MLCGCFLIIFFYPIAECSYRFFATLKTVLEGLICKGNCKNGGFVPVEILGWTESILRVINRSVTAAKIYEVTTKTRGFFHLFISVSLTVLKVGLMPLRHLGIVLRMIILTKIHIFPSKYAEFSNKKNYNLHMSFYSSAETYAENRRVP